MQWIKGAKAFLQAGSLQTLRIGVIHDFIDAPTLDAWWGNLIKLYGEPITKPSIVVPPPTVPATGKDNLDEKSSVAVAAVATAASAPPTATANPSETIESSAGATAGATAFWYFLSDKAHLECFAASAKDLVDKPLDLFVCIVNVSDDRYVDIVKTWIAQIEKQGKKLLLWLHAVNVPDDQMDCWSRSLSTPPSSAVQKTLSLKPLARTIHGLSTAHFVGRLALFRMDLDRVNLVMGNVTSLKQVQRVVSDAFKT